MSNEAQEFTQQSAMHHSKVDQTREARWRAIEMLVWPTAASLALISPIYHAGRGASASYLIDNVGGNLALALFLLTFPILFSLIFGELPLQLVRRTLKERDYGAHWPSIGLGAGPLSATINFVGANLTEADTNIARASGRELLARHCSESYKLSRGIYTRAGVYLLTGVIFSIAGLVVFYSQTLPTTLKLVGIEFALFLAPKFGILFFIELVAFYFLRQHKSAMEEFRYYEAIKRKRQENLALIAMLEDMGEKLPLIDILKTGTLYSTPPKLEKDQSTEILEAKKLERDELELMEKILTIIGRGK